MWFGVLVPLLLVVACSSGKPDAAPTQSPAGPTSAAATPSASTTPSPTPSPTSSALPVVLHLAWIGEGHVHVITLDRGGHPAGEQLDLGAIGDYERVSWSPKGRYLAWRTAGPDGTLLHIWDSRTGRASSSPLPLASDLVRASGTGARVVVEEGSALYVYSYDRNGKRIGRQRVGATSDSVSLVPDPQTLVEVIKREADGGDLTLVAANGRRRGVGHVAAIDFLGRNTPRLETGALRPDGLVMAVSTGLGQDGGCAPDGQVHRIGLGNSEAADLPVTLPQVGGEASVQPLALSYSPEGVLGVVVAQCHEAGDVESGWFELERGAWVLRQRDVYVATRGPFGLLARVLGEVTTEEYGPVPKGSPTLEIVNRGGNVTFDLGPATSAVWQPVP